MSEEGGSVGSIPYGVITLFVIYMGPSASGICFLPVACLKSCIKKFILRFFSFNTILEIGSTILVPAWPPAPVLVRVGRHVAAFLFETPLRHMFREWPSVWVGVTKANFRSQEPLHRFCSLNFTDKGMIQELRFVKWNDENFMYLVECRNDSECRNEGRA